jgi:hypothetical protein
VIRLAGEGQATENGGMVIDGRVLNGVVVLEGGCCVPEGTHVTVIVPAAPPGRERVATSPKAAWDSIFANKLVIGSAPTSADDKDLELTGDDFLF